jgi:hypothetical protein
LFPGSFHCTHKDAKIVVIVAFTDQISNLF